MAEIGQTLREARMRARIDVNEVERRTKIRAKYLRAMENEEFELLPGPIYVKSFLKTYGDFLGLDTRMLIDDYKRSYERPTDQELRPIAPVGRERERTPRRLNVPPWAIVGVVLVAVVVVLGIVGSNNGSKAPSPIGSTARPPGTNHRGTHTRRAKPAVSAPPNVTLQLVPTGNVYVCVVNASGRRLINGKTFSKGDAVPTLRAQKLRMTLGNNGVTVMVNHRPVPIPASSSAIGLELTPGSTRPLAAAQQPTCA